MERSPGTVTTVVREAGLSFERGPEVAAATEARKADNATRRASSVGRLYDLADRLLARLESDTFKATAESWGAVVVSELPQDAAPAGDVRSLASSVSNLLQSAAKLEQVDAGRSGAEGAVSVITALGEQMRALVGEYPGDRKADE